MVNKLHEAKTCFSIKTYKQITMTSWNKKKILRKLIPTQYRWEGTKAKNNSMFLNKLNSQDSCFLTST